MSACLSLYHILVLCHNYQTYHQAYHSGVPTTGSDSSGALSTDAIWRIRHIQSVYVRDVFEDAMVEAITKGQITSDQGHVRLSNPT